MDERLSDLGEFGVIGRLLERVPTTGDGVLVGPGDDAAVIDVGGRSMLVTTDLLIEGRHFDPALSSPSDVGYKALAVNISDVAAMGGEPRWATVSVGVPAATRVALVEEIYDGVAEAAEAFGVVVVGGDTVGADGLVLSIAMLADAPDGAILRSGAGDGDILCVTGALGGAAAGLALLRAAPHDPRAVELLERSPGLAAAHRRPQPRVREGRAAAATGAHAMIDVSDGLAQDVRHLCEASKIGVVIDVPLPRAPGVDEVEVWLGDGRSLAATGGDDYELLIAVPPGAFEQLWAAVAPTTLTAIGRFGGDLIPEASGWDSFRGP